MNDVEQKIKQFLDKINLKEAFSKIVYEATCLYDCPLMETPAFKKFLKKVKNDKNS